MRKLTQGLLICVYLFAAMTVAAMLWRSGAEWAASLAALFGVLGVALAAHALILNGMHIGGVRHELEQMREAQRLLADALESTQHTLSDLAGEVEDKGSKATEALSSDVKMLESLVERMGAAMEEKFAVWRSTPARGGPAPVRRDARSLMLETVREALLENRVDLYLQPVVRLPQRRITFYESFSRLRDASDRIIMPSEYLAVAEPEGLVPAIDNLLLFRCVQIVRRLAKQDRRIGIFCNVSLHSLQDEVFFPQFLEFLADNKDLSGALIFEIGQDMFEARSPAAARNMAKLADMGFRFSIDKVNTLDLDIQDLQRSDVRFLKIAAGLLLSQLTEIDNRPALAALKDIHASDFAAMMRRYGVEVIAEKVETERQVVDVLELEISYGQGNLFGEPRAIKEQVLAETDPPADFLRSALTLKRRSGRG